MAIVYYPTEAATITRYISGGQMVELFVDVAPDQILVLSGSVPATASTNFLTASYAQTASIALNAVGGGGETDYIGNQVFS